MELYKEICAIAENCNEIQRLVLFGSRATKTHRENSDVNIAIFLNRGDFHQRQSFFHSVEQLNTLLTVNLVVVNGKTGEELLQKIQETGVILLERRGKKDEFRISVKRLEEAVKECQIQSSPVVLDGLLLRFSYSMDLAWKTCQEQLEEKKVHGEDEVIKVLRKALQQGLISDSDVWLAMLGDWEKMKTFQSAELSKEIACNIAESYLTAFQKLENAGGFY